MATVRIWDAEWNLISTTKAEPVIVEARESCVLGGQYFTVDADA